MMTNTILMHYGCAIQNRTSPLNTIKACLKKRFPHFNSDTLPPETLLSATKLVGILDLTEYLPSDFDEGELPATAQLMASTLARSVWHIERREKARYHLKPDAPVRLSAPISTEKAKKALASLLVNWQDPDGYPERLQAMVATTTPYIITTPDTDIPHWEAAFDAAGMSPKDDEIDDLPNEIAYWTGMGILAGHFLQYLLLARCPFAVVNPLLNSTHFFKDVAHSVMEEFSQKAGFSIRSSKMLDVFSELIGEDNGYQALKPKLLSEAKINCASKRYLTRPSSHFITQFRFMVDGGVSLIESTVRPPIELIHLVQALRDFQAELLALFNNRAIAQDNICDSLFTEVFGNLAKNWYIAMATRALTTPVDMTKTWGEWEERLTEKTMAMVPRYERNITDYLEHVSYMMCRFIGLHQPSQGPHNGRPHFSDEDIIREAIKPVAKTMNADVNGLIENFSPMMDGFTLAMRLRDDGWSVSREDVDTLDLCEYNHSMLYEKMEWLWADTTHPTPSLNIGTQVVINDALKQKIGVITDIDVNKAAVYTVEIDSCENNTQRRFVPFERVKLV